MSLRSKTMVALVISLALFMAVGVAGAARADALANMVLLESRGIGGVSGVAQTTEGTLVIGFTYEMSGRWVVFLNHDGKEMWSHAEADRDCWYRCPTALPGGGFAAIREDADDSLSIVVFDSNGQVVADRPIPPLSRDIVAAGDSIFVCGNQRIIDEDGYEVEGLPFLARFCGEAEPAWSLEYAHEYEQQYFGAAVYAADSLFITANATNDYLDSWRGSLYRMDLDGNVLWNVVFDPELVDETRISDVCVSEDGIIAVIVSDWAYNADYGYNIDGLHSIIGLNMDGEILWKYRLNNGVSSFPDLISSGGVAAHYIVPVEDGFLCAGSRMATAASGSGFVPIEWMLCLDKEGRPIGTGDPTDLRDDRVQIDGLARGADGKAILYGGYIAGLDNLEEYEYGDTPGKPFYAMLDFSEVYVPACVPVGAAEEERIGGEVFARIGGHMFNFLSGVGGWSTEVVVSEDGSFTGHFHDTDMGDTGDDYPEGTLYECIFTGRFAVTGKIDPYTYELRLVVLNLDGDIGAKRIVDGVKVITAGAYGIEGGDAFMLYCPGRATADLPEAFLEWICMPNAWEKAPGTLPFYGLYNVEAGTGFFSGTD